MEQHIHSHVFRNKDVDRLMASYGNKPSGETKAKLQSHLEKQRSKFIEVSRIRELEKSRKMGRSR